MILIKKTLDSRIAGVLAEIIIEDDLPIHIDIGRSSGGNTEVLFAFNPEDEPVYLKLINVVLETLYPL